MNDAFTSETYTPGNGAGAGAKSREPWRRPIVVEIGLETAPRYSDEALALTFAGRHVGGLRYVAAWGQWLSWAATHWKPDTTLHAFDLARRIAREEAATCNSKKTAIPLASAKTVAAVERLAKADRRLAATDDQWDHGQTDFNMPTEGD